MGRTRRESATREDLAEERNEQEFKAAWRREVFKQHSNGCGDDGVEPCRGCQAEKRSAAGQKERQHYRMRLRVFRQHPRTYFLLRARR
jgi:hypothetical protein